MLMSIVPRANEGRRASRAARVDAQAMKSVMRLQGSLCVVPVARALRALTPVTAPGMPEAPVVLGAGRAGEGDQGRAKVKPQPATGPVEAAPPKPRLIGKCKCKQPKADR